MTEASLARLPEAGGRTSPSVVGMLTVSVVVAAEPLDGVTETGEKLQDAPVGRPPRANVTADEKAESDATVNVEDPDCPEPMVSEAGVADKLKSGTRV